MRAASLPFTPALEQQLRAWLAEDIGRGDLAAPALAGRRGEAQWLARQAGVFCGGVLVAPLFALLDPAVEVRLLVADGERLRPDQRVLELRGQAAALVAAERTALNLAMRLSGIATATAALVAQLEGTGVALADTRKTTPGLRALEKAAVRAGGCVNHRGNLSEWVMLKDNHLTGTTITEAVTRARSWWPGRTVQVECDRVEQVAEAVTAGADAVLLDNMDPTTAARAVAVAREGDHRVLVEISGGVTLDTIGTYSRLGADCISVGAITASAPTLDVGLDLEPGA